MSPTSILVVFILTVESSYQQNVERPHGAVADTVQFWFSPNDDWRVKTFAIDHDIHVHRIRAADAERKFGPEEAKVSTRKSYADVIEAVAVLEFTDPNDRAEVDRTLRSHSLGGSLEIGKTGVAFYNPDGGHHRTQSKPE